jgi:hypothetical protein
MSCYHDPENTALLKRLIAEGRVVVDTASGIPCKPCGTPYTLELNWGGYLRFRVNLSKKRDGERRSPWFFVHKAVVLATGREIPERMQIDHIDRDKQNNAGSNLRIVSYSDNLANRLYNPAFYGEPAF